jgi:hypothetical protein
MSGRHVDVGDVIAFDADEPSRSAGCASVRRAHLHRGPASGDSPEQDRPVKLTAMVRLHSRGRT